MKQSHSQPVRSAFTLVELLVVIGIIALLISILLPSLNRARQAAQSVRCLANLRQISGALSFYTNDYKQLVPLGYDVWDVSTIPAGQDYFDGDTKTITGVTPNITGHGVYWQERLAPYLAKDLEKPFARQGKNKLGGLRAKGKWVFFCPSDTEYDDASAYYKCWFSYVVNFYATGDAGQAYPPKAVRVTRLKNSSDLIFCMDGSGATGLWASSGKFNNAVHNGFPSLSTTATAGYNFTRRHNRNQSANALFCDGHAETLTSEVSDVSLLKYQTVGYGLTDLDRRLLPQPFISQATGGPQ